jgi:glycosyltransferase involved in cell wall biosynthesis
MRVTFILPCYAWTPSGGVKVVYEYANCLTRRGHQVTVVQPLRLAQIDRGRPSILQRTRRHLRRQLFAARGWLGRPRLQWQEVDPRVNTHFVPTLHHKNIPDADVVFATSWHTVNPVLRWPASKGEKCYLIQGYEVWQGPEELVNDTWRCPMHKIVVSKWLLDKGIELGCDDVTYIPIAINHDLYRLTRPIEGRTQRVVMMYSCEHVKGSLHGIEALRIAKESVPGLKAVFFSATRRRAVVPSWVEYYENPPQDFIIENVLGASSVFISPSLCEGWGLPATEAAACGCAIVSTDNGGAREYVHHGITGLLSPVGDPVSLAHNLCTVLKDDALRIRLAKAGHRVVSELSWERSTDRLETFMQRLFPVGAEYALLD